MPCPQKILFGQKEIAEYKYLRQSEQRPKKKGFKGSNRNVT